MKLQNCPHVLTNLDFRCFLFFFLFFWVEILGAFVVREGKNITRVFWSQGFSKIVNKKTEPVTLCPKDYCPCHISNLRPLFLNHIKRQRERDQSGQIYFLPTQRILRGEGGGTV